MKKSDQLEFDFSPKGVVISKRFACDHQFRTDEFTDHEVCESCGLVVPHDYIIDNYNLKEWPSNEV